MFCPNCGENLPEGSKFCSACGANLSELLSEEETKVSETSAETAASVAADKQPDYVKPKKKKNIKLIAGIAAAAVIVIIVAFAVKVLLSLGSGGDNVYVYMSDGKYELLTNLKKDQTIEIASGKNNAIYSNLLSFSPDGSYIYYYTKYDPSAGTGSLCRAEYGKLKEDSAKNDNYIEVIATNVSLGFQFLDDGTVIYINGDNTLYCYDGSEVEQIAKNVNYYYIDGSNRLVYETGDYSEGYTLYGVSLDDKDNKIKLAANYYYVYDAGDFDHILYAKEDEDYNESLYVVGFENDSEKLGDNVSIFSDTDGAVYFTATNGNMLTLYDYVEDSYADADAGIKEPDIEEYRIPTYRYDMVRGSDLKESDYAELYTSCTEDLYWFGESSWWSYSMEDAIDQSWGDDTDAIAAATKSFIDKYADTADEDGYILVTDEVKADLQAINNADSETEAWKWLWLCFDKQESGTSYDYDTYNADRDKYNEAKDRISLREELQSKDNAYAVKTLYCYDNGALTTISENVLDAIGCKNAVMYNTTDLVTEKPKMEKLSSVYDVTDLFGIDSEAQNYLVTSAGATSVQMSEKAAEAYAEAYENGYAYLYAADSVVYMNERDGALYAAEISGGKVGDFSVIVDDAEVYSIDGSSIYYISGVYTNNDYNYGDLSVYSDGKSRRIAQDVMSYNGNLYSDDVLLVYTGYRSNYGYELTMFEPDGSKTIIADDVTQYIRVDKSTLLYISDNDLYMYDGKEKTMIRDDAEMLWSLTSMEIQQTFGWYEYDYNYDYGYDY